MTKTVWTDDKIRQLTYLWNNETLVKDIGKIMEITKNAVIGKAYRLDLKRRYTDPRKEPSIISIEPTKVVMGRNFIKGIEPTPPVKVSKDTTPYGIPKTMMELQGDECMWPVSERPNMTFCAGKIAKGSYCSNHAKKAYVVKKSKPN